MARSIVAWSLLCTFCGCGGKGMVGGAADGGAGADAAGSVDAGDPDGSAATDGEAADAGPVAPVCPSAVSAPPPSTISEGIVPPLPWDLAAVTGTDHSVGSLPELLAALEVVAPGDAISLEGGTYDGWGQVELPLAVSGTADAPIVIRSSGSPVIFTGDTSFRIRGHHVHFYGLTFDGVSGGAVSVDGRASDPSAGIRLSRIHCREVAGLCLYIEDAVGTRFDHSLVEKSQSKGVHVGNESMFSRIDHNVFRDRPTSTDPNGFEQVQLGHARFTSTDEGVDSVRVIRTDALVDHNVFSKCEGEGEMIGIKTANNKIVFNVIVDAHERGRLSLRSGPNNLVFGNVFRDTRGAIRFMGKANRAVHNLVVDPIQYAGLDLPWGSDTAYMPDEASYWTVEYIASRGGLIRSNTFVSTSHVSSSARAIAEDPQSEGECRAGTAPDGTDLDCTVVPFDNTLSHNVVINDRGGSTIGLAPEFLSQNTLADNVLAVSSEATLGSTSDRSAALEPHFPAASAEVAAAHRALAEQVWAPSPDVCLRLDSPGELEGAVGVQFAPGTCELPCEDPGAAWLAVDLFESEALDSFIDHDTLRDRIAAMPAAAVPPIPPRP